MFEKRSDLKKFLKIVQVGKINQASSELGITQPALTRLVAKLESDFNGQLFERVPNGVRLTPFGEFIADKAKHLQREFELAEAEIDALNAGRRGSLRISAGPVWMAAVLPAAVSRFHKVFPALEIHLRTATFKQALSLLANGEIDIHCGVFDSHPNLPHFIDQRFVVEVTLGVMAHQSHPLFRNENPGPEQLAEYPWVLSAHTRENSRPVDDWPSLKEILDDIATISGQRPQSIIYNDPIGIWLMKHGPYLTYLPEILASNISECPLRSIPIQLSNKPISSGVTFRGSLQGSAAFEALFDSIQTTIDGFQD